MKHVSNMFLGPNLHRCLDLRSVAVMMSMPISRHLNNVGPRSDHDRPPLEESSTALHRCFIMTLLHALMLIIYLDSLWSVCPAKSSLPPNFVCCWFPVCALCSSYRLQWCRGSEVDVDAGADAYHLDGSLYMVRGSCRGRRRD